MTHFCVIVAIDDPQDLEQALAPFSEFHMVSAYRDYLADWQGEYETERRFYETHPDHKPKGLDLNDVTATLSAAWCAEVQCDEEGDYYTMTTRNPDAQWDGWVVGGRYAGHFKLRDQLPPALPELPQQYGTCAPGTANGAPKRFIDLDGMRDAATERAGRAWGAFGLLRRQNPAAQAWSTFRARHLHHPRGYSFHRARAEYDAQPLIQAYRRSPLYESFDECPIDRFALSWDSLIQRARTSAPLGYALLTREGEWISAEELGWWGASLDLRGNFDAYAEKADDYITALPDDAYLIAVDCHV